jgi:fermentation-respiration switch protein FrsA (DUF1100 family)
LKRRILVIARWTALVLFGWFVVFVGMATYMQTDVMFPRWQVLYSPAPAPSSGITEETLSCVDAGGKQRVWFHPPGKAEAIIVYFPGNGMSLGQSFAAVQPFIAEGYGTLLLSYPGYEENEGTPGEASINAGVECALDWLDAQQSASALPRIYYGYSMGTGVAATAALKHQPRAVLLDAPYTSLADAASATTGIPTVLTRLLLRTNFKTTPLCEQTDIPLFIAHGTKDYIVPYKLGAALSEKCAEQATFIMVDGAGHLDLTHHDVAIKQLRWLNTLL